MRHACLFLLFTLTGAAQWLNYPAKGIPRLPDGKPNLAAPTPETPDGKPDFSGIWKMTSPVYGIDILKGQDADALMLEPAAKLYGERQTTKWKDDPTSWCLPFGVARGLIEFRFVQLTDLMMQVSSLQPVREIFLDGRPHPADPNPSWLGYSVGSWDGKTLVVETIGFNGRQWLDTSGHPMSDKARVTERLSRPDFGHLDIEMTLEDPVNYRKPLTVQNSYQLTPDTQILEFVCIEGNNSLGKHVAPPK